LGQAAILITYRDICRREPTLDDLAQILSKYCRREVIGFIAKLNILVGTWKNGPSFEIDEILSSIILKKFKPQLQSIWLMREKRVVFSRLSLLYLLKKACLFCPETGLATNSENGLADIGLCCLMANDLVLPFLPSKSDDTLAKLANTLPFMDYISKDHYPMEIARTQIMFQESAHAKKLKSRGDYLDIENLFMETIGILEPFLPP